MESVRSIPGKDTGHDELDNDFDRVDRSFGWVPGWLFLGREPRTIQR